MFYRNIPVYLVLGLIMCLAFWLLGGMKSQPDQHSGNRASDSRILARPLGR